MTKLRRLLAIVSPKHRPASTCEACGGAFTCGASLAGCWCMKVEVPKDVRASLRERYTKCLCPACLEAAAAEGAGAMMGADVQR